MRQESHVKARVHGLRTQGFDSQVDSPLVALPLGINRCGNGAETAEVQAERRIWSIDRNSDPIRLQLTKVRVTDSFLP
jgi:hypothetical protein